MIKSVNDKDYLILSKEKEESLHKEAFNDTYLAIKRFSIQSQEIYKHINKKEPDDFENLYIHKALCSAPGHGKTTALEYHIKSEIIQVKIKKQPYLLVFNNNDTMNTFYEDVASFANEYGKVKSILAINEQNFDQFKTVLDQYQIVCIMQQRLKNLAIGLGDPNAFLSYQQEQMYWGKRPPKVNKTLAHRTVIIDEMPEFFNKVIFDIGKENNAIDWYDTFAANTDEKRLTSEEKNSGRLYISKLINSELNSIGSTTHKLVRSILDTSTETELFHILNSLNKNNADNESINRYRQFIKLLQEDDVGAINHTSKKTNILCSEFINYHPFGNILILDGTANLTHTIYDFAGFEIELIHNYHRYADRLFFEWCKINTSKRKRTDDKSEVRNQIANDIIEKRKKGMDILPIPSKSDMKFYIKSGAITPEQQKKFFMVKQNDTDSLAINIHNVTGKNDLNGYNHIALLNLPIMQPDEYRLQAIAMYGVNIDLRLVKELDRESRTKYKGKWFVEDRLQQLFEEQQKAELSQIIHRSSIRNINSNEKVTIFNYHNKKQVNGLLKDIFNLPDSNFSTVNVQQKNNVRAKCWKWAEKISKHLKKNPNVEFTASHVSDNKFRYWLKDNWKDYEAEIREIFKEFDITITVKGKKNYKYFSYIEDEDIRLLTEFGDDDLFA